MRARAMLATSLFALPLTAAVLGAAPGCMTDETYVTCDSVVTRCRNVCNTWCDDWGCYPSCSDQCWDECRAPASASTPAPAAGASTTLPAAVGVLCSACTSNDDCGGGGLCVQRGGGDAGDGGAGAPFCSVPCASSTDCPSGFACERIGSSSQCLPTTGRCE